MEFIYRAITVWPGTLKTVRRRSTFSATYSKTLELLDHELRQLGAKNIVLQLAMRDEDIRLDGRPRSGSKVAHPGVILSFDSKYGPLSYPCDTFGEWQDNLRAIALALEHLRAVDRYGVTRGGEQYRGWTALPAPPGKMTRAEATELLQRFTLNKIETADDARAAYRAGVMKCHPDRGGSAKELERVVEAKEVLEL